MNLDTTILQSKTVTELIVFIDRLVATGGIQVIDSDIHDNYLEIKRKQRDAMKRRGVKR